MEPGTGAEGVCGGPVELTKAVKPYGCSQEPDSTKEEEEILLSLYQPMNIYCRVLISLFLEMLGVVGFSIMNCCVIKRENYVLNLQVHYKGGHFPLVTSWF